MLRNNWRLFAICWLAFACYLEAQTGGPTTARGIGVEKRPVAPGAPVDASAVPHGYALVIGVSKYKNLPKERNLAYPESDAELIYDKLIDKHAGNFRPEDVKRLIGPDANLANITEAVEVWLPKVVDQGDRVVIYFAGHGFLDSAGKGYLAPYDVDESALGATGYPMQRLAKVVGGLKARWKVLFADACHSGVITPDVIQKVNDDLQALPDMFVFTASRKRESSYEDRGLKHGLFTYYLAQALDGNADEDRNGVVTADELVDYVRSNVRQHVKRINADLTKKGLAAVDEQNPIENQDFDSGLILALNAKLDSLPDRPGLAQGSIRVDVNREGVEILLDGKTKGVAAPGKPITMLGVAQGEYEIRGVKQGYEDDTKRVVVFPGRETPVQIRIQILRTRKKASADLVNRAKAMWDRGSEREIREAVKLASQALGEDPTYAGAALVLGRSYQVLDDTDKALQYLEMAVKLEPSWVEARTAWSSALLEAGKTDEAIAELREGASLQPRDSLLYSHMAHAFFLAGAYDKGIESARNSVALYAANAQAFLWMGNCERQLKQFPEAVDAYHQAAKLLDFDPSVARKIAWLSGFVMITPFNWKQRATEKVVYRDQKNLVFFGLCECEYLLGDLARAVTDCNKALTYDPNDFFSYLVLGKIHVAMSNGSTGRDAHRITLTKARDYYQKAVAINPDADEAQGARVMLDKIDSALKKLGS